MISERLQQRIANLTGDSTLQDMAMRTTDPVSPPMKIGDMPTGGEPMMLGADEMSAEDKETLESMLQRAEQVSMAPLSEIAQELAMQGEGEDTQLAHLRPGEVYCHQNFLTMNSLKAQSSVNLKSLILTLSKQ